MNHPTCKRCKGTGKITIKWYDFTIGTTNETKTCSLCKGTGYVKSKYEKTTNP